MRSTSAIREIFSMHIIYTDVEDSNGVGSCRQLRKMRCKLNACRAVTLVGLSNAGALRHFDSSFLLSRSSRNADVSVHLLCLEFDLIQHRLCKAAKAPLRMRAATSWRGMHHEHPFRALLFTAKCVYTPLGKISLHQLLKNTQCCVRAELMKPFGFDVSRSSVYTALSTSD